MVTARQAWHYRIVPCQGMNGSMSFFIDEDRFIFASELKALYDFGIPKELNYEALQLYLQLSYIPQPMSMLKHVRKVEPGARLILRGKNIEEKNKLTFLSFTITIHHLQFTTI